MLKAITAEQARSVERSAVAAGEVDLFGLMQLAGEALATECMTQLADAGRVAVVCGPGNNGGDGWICATQLHSAGIEAVVFSAADPGSLHAEARRAAETAIDDGVAWERVGESVSPDVLGSFDIVLDAILGTGSRLPLSDEFRRLCAAINGSGSLVVAADVPTGISSDDGARDDGAVRADVTVTFTAPKLGLVTHPAAAHSGEVIVADLGIGSYLEGIQAPELWQAQDLSARVPRPASDAHKNSRGRLLVVAGSGRFPGAAVLAAKGAMRMGAGYVTLAVPEPVVLMAQSHLLATPVVGLPSSRTRGFASQAAEVLLELAADHDAVVMGPGMTLSDGAVGTARRLYSALTKPLVVDADGLNAFVDARDLLDARTAPTVLTPHAGELARLVGSTSAAIQADRLAAGRSLVAPERVVLLKGAGSVVSGLDRQAIVTTGTPALATAGTGDVLAGMVGSLLAQGLAPFEAALLGAHLHGLAGELAEADLTTLCVTAEDLPDYLPRALAEVL